MTSISISDVLTIIFVLVDDWYQMKAVQRAKSQRGRKPKFTDSEVLTLMLAQDFIPFASETQFLAYIRANHLDLFPHLLDQSQYNRRARFLRMSVEEIRRFWIIQRRLLDHTNYLLDTKPIPVMGYKRHKQHSDFLGSAAYGYCASRKMKYFGYKLVTISTLKGIPIVYDLVPANVDERLAAETVTGHLSYCDIFADKGFIGFEWQTKLFDQTGNMIWTPMRSNQDNHNSKGLDLWLCSVRERIEGVFHELQNTGRNIERLLAKTVHGFCTRIATKLTSHLLRFILRHDYGIDVQTFSVSVSGTF